MGVPPIGNESYHSREPAASKPLHESGIDTGTKSPGLTAPRLGLLLEWEIWPLRLVAPAAAPACSCRSRADRFGYVYLRDAQAYMLISMPTCTSTIFGVFQVIGGLPQSWRNAHAGVERKTSSEATQEWNCDQRLGCDKSDSRYFARGQGHFPLGQSTARYGDRLTIYLPCSRATRDRYFNSRNRAFPARLFNSFASRVPSLSGLAALKRRSTTARYSSTVSVPS